jgi:hypothetical protein
MDFKTFYRGLDQQAREDFAKRVASTPGYCNQIAWGGKQIELGLADAIVAASRQVVTLDELPLTDKAKLQNKARQWDGKERRAKSPSCNGPKGK